MKQLLVSTQRLKLYTLLGVLGLMLSCESWNLPPGSDSLTDGLIAYYPLSGTTLDLSSNRLNGQLINGATYGPDRNGTAQSALQLDGIDDYFEIADNAKLRPDSISISLWLKAKKVVDPADGGSTRHIYNKDNYATHENQQYSAFIGNPRSPASGTVCCEYTVDVNNDDTCTVEQPIKNRMTYHASTFELNRWYHFVSVFSGQTVKLYINGELKMVQRELTTNPIDRCAGGNLRFGAQAAYDSNNFNGWIDEIRIYNRPLTQTEINALSRQ